MRTGGKGQDEVTGDGTAEINRGKETADFAAKSLLWRGISVFFGNNRRWPS
jgi:hypothetical protein